MTEADTLAVAQLWHSAWHASQGPHVPQALIDLRTLPDFTARLGEMVDHTCLAVSGPGLLGFCTTRDDTLYQLFVAEQAQGTGTGSALIRDAADRLRQDGTAVARLDCLVENTHARRFYERHGWALDSIGPATLDTSAGPFTLDCAIYTKVL